ncbi:MAG: nitrous oxide-stimulated promoter family protein [Oscillospiraceae bacterium]
MHEKALQDKRQQEKQVLQHMLLLYCRKAHKKARSVISHKQACPSCQKLLAYSFKRIDLCPLMQNKTFCSNCHIHCYTPENRAQIRTVMRHAGPRMLLHHPVLAVRHLITSKRQKKGLAQ